MCQLWIDIDPQVDLIELARRSDRPGLRDMAVFDAVVNNADRKIGHLLPVRGGHLYGCDHGVCFAEEYKLRTVLWQWRGKSLPRRAIEALRRWPRCSTAANWASELSQYLSPDEVEATHDPGRQAAQAPRPSVPTRGLARHPLAPVLKMNAGGLLWVPTVDRTPGNRANAVIAPVWLPSRHNSHQGNCCCSQWMERAPTILPTAVRGWRVVTSGG